MTIFMETTRIDANRTIAEIHACLQQHGVTAILNDIQAGKITAVSFRFPVDGEDVPFRLPCRWEKIEVLLKKEDRRPAYGDTYEIWARRVAWRQILRWVEAQMALVQTNMVKVEEVFLPYRQAANGQTIFEMVEARGVSLLEGPKK